MHRLPCSGQPIEGAGRRGKHPPDFRAGYSTGRVGPVGECDGAIGAEIDNHLTVADEPVDVSGQVVLRMTRNHTSPTRTVVIPDDTEAAWVMQALRRRQLGRRRAGQAPWCQSGANAG